MKNDNSLPVKPTNGNWLGWVDQFYPFAEDWETYLRTRRERPVPGSPESLNDLRGIRDRDSAADLAQLWFYINENTERINSAVEADKRENEEKERGRLIRISRLALDGKLGESADAKDTARATAQHYLRQSPENCSFDELQDWEKMHAYSKQIAQGRNVPRPMLSSDIRREAERRRSIDDINDSIGAAIAARPRESKSAANL